MRGDKLTEVPDDKLEAHTRSRVTPEMVEWVKRLALEEKPGKGSSSAYFNYWLGMRDRNDEIIAAFQRLLDEATNPEKI